MKANIVNSLYTILLFFFLHVQADTDPRPAGSIIHSARRNYTYTSTGNTNSHRSLSLWSAFLNFLHCPPIGPHSDSCDTDGLSGNTSESNAANSDAQNDDGSSSSSSSGSGGNGGDSGSDSNSGGSKTYWWGGNDGDAENGNDGGDDGGDNGNDRNSYSLARRAFNWFAMIVGFGLLVAGAFIAGVAYKTNKVRQGKTTRTTPMLKPDPFDKKSGKKRSFKQVFSKRFGRKAPAPESLPTEMVEAEMISEGNLVGDTRDVEPSTPYKGDIA